jgi:putative transposase
MLTTKVPMSDNALAKLCLKRLSTNDCPGAHRLHVRSSNVIQSVFATVRARTHETKGCKIRLATLIRVIKLTHQTQMTWRRPDDSKRLGLVHAELRIADGVLQEETVAYGAIRESMPPPTRIFASP